MLLDEPDVHLHPDLQASFARFLIDQFSSLSNSASDKILIIIATHSTSLICELASSSYTSIGTKHFDVDVVKQRLADSTLKKAAPFFAHPFSKSISDDPLLILEGEDDERVWQQASRTSQGRIHLFPCLAHSVDQQSQLEHFCSDLLSAIYDDPVAYSLRDGDGNVGSMSAIGPLKRFRLQCYAIENLLLTDDCLKHLNSSWEDFAEKSSNWTTQNENHRDAQILQAIVISDDRFRHRKIKVIRQLICSILGSTKPWEFHVGQTLGLLSRGALLSSGHNSISEYVGLSFLQEIGFSLARTNGIGS